MESSQRRAHFVTRLPPSTVIGILQPGSMTTEGKDQDIVRLQEENAALQQRLREVKQRKQEKAARKAHAKLAKLQEQLQAVTALKTAKDTRAGNHSLRHIAASCRFTQSCSLSGCLDDVLEGHIYLQTLYSCFMQRLWSCRWMRSIEWRHSCALVTSRCACILYCSTQEVTIFRAVVSINVFCDVYYLAVQLFTSAVTWDPSASPSLWGPEVEPHGHFAEPGFTWQNFDWYCKPKQLRIFKQPFAIGGMRLAYCALDTETGRRRASHLLENRHVFVSHR